MEIKSVEECNIEDMPKIETKRRVTAMDTELSKDPLDENDPGYQAPEPKEESVSQPQKQNKPKDKEEGEQQQKKGKHHKIYNPDIKEKKDDKDGDKRRDRDNHGKHEQDKDNNQPKKDRKKKFQVE